MAPIMRMIHEGLLKCGRAGLRANIIKMGDVAMLALESETNSQGITSYDSRIYGMLVQYDSVNRNRIFCGNMDSTVIRDGQRILGYQKDIT